MMGSAELHPSYEAGYVGWVELRGTHQNISQAVYVIADLIPTKMWVIYRCRSIYYHGSELTQHKANEVNP
jgi:hypothetical protein